MRYKRMPEQEKIEQLINALDSCGGDVRKLLGKMPEYKSVYYITEMLRKYNIEYEKFYYNREDNKGYSTSDLKRLYEECGFVNSKLATIIGTRCSNLIRILRDRGIEVRPQGIISKKENQIVKKCTSCGNKTFNIKCLICNTSKFLVPSVLRLRQVEPGDYYEKKTYSKNSG